jgi:hypothetical protein
MAGATNGIKSFKGIRNGPGEEAYWARKSRHVTCRRNFIDLVNLPKQVPRCTSKDLRAKTS